MPSSPSEEEESKMAYGKDFRQRAMEMLDSGSSGVEVSKVLNIGYATLHRWKKRQGCGTLAPEYPTRRKPYKIDEEKLKSYVKENPDAYAYEIAEAIGSKRGTVESALKRLKITRKKRLRNIENGIQKNEKPI